MSRKHVVKSHRMLDAADMSGNLTSEPTNVLQLDKASIYIAWSGSSVSGTIEVQARNGEKAPWYALDFGSAISLATDSGSHVVVLNETPFSDIRIVYTRSAGTGSVDAILTMKSVGA